MERQEPLPFSSALLVVRGGMVDALLLLLQSPLRLHDCFTFFGLPSLLMTGWRQIDHYVESQRTPGVPVLDCPTGGHAGEDLLEDAGGFGLGVGEGWR